MATGAPGVHSAPARAPVAQASSSGPASATTHSKLAVVFPSSPELQLWLLRPLPILRVPIAACHSGESARAGILFPGKKVRLGEGSLMALVAQPAGSRAGPGALKTWSPGLLSIPRRLCTLLQTLAGSVLPGQVYQGHKVGQRTGIRNKKEEGALGSQMPGTGAGGATVCSQARGRASNMLPEPSYPGEREPGEAAPMPTGLLLPTMLSFLLPKFGACCAVLPTFSLSLSSPTHTPSF